MDGNEVHRGPNVTCREFRNELVAPDAKRLRPKPEDEEVPGVRHVRPRHGNLERLVIGEGAGVTRHNLASPPLEFLLFAQLAQSHGGLDVSHVVLEAGDHDLVEPAPALVVSLPAVPRHSMQAEYAGRLATIPRGRELVLRGR